MSRGGWNGARAAGAENLRWVLAVMIWMGCGAACAWGSGPRFVQPTNTCCNTPGLVEAFYTTSPLYYTDAGDLAPGVTHAQADAMVAAAAAVWNVPTASVTLAQGGTLAEDVNGTNTYFDGTSMVFPADVQASNYASVQIAVIYDSDGSVTDLLLGGGASAPAGCRQNGVTESVDSFGSNTIQHAILVLNGRCVGSTPQQLTQMQYQLARAFGRVLGLAWSQCNDNVFTGAFAPTSGQLQNWPLMHPIDIVCGPYTYQCMQNPFSLRPDDLSGLELLYNVSQANSSTGKTPSLANGDDVLGVIYFPTGQGMDMINLVTHRQPAGWNGPQDWEVAATVTGARYQQNVGNPITGGESSAQNAGGSYPILEGYFEFGYMETDAATSFYIDGEPVNPLYTGVYALGPFQRPSLTPSGTAAHLQSWMNPPNFTWGVSATVGDAAQTCGTVNDGSEGSPAAGDPSGWWNGQVCAYGHTSWWSVPVKANRTWTVEVTALDDSGAATMTKMQPVIGVWAASDATGTRPTVAAATVAMNSMAAGVTQARVLSATVDSSYRIAMADQFGAGRPDFNYTARVLYADSVSPARVPANGGQITITGMGFRQGNVVKVNGVTARVVSWSSGQIVASAPAATVARGTAGLPLNVSVSDLTTGGSSTMAAALSYAPPTNTLQGVSAPTALETGVTAGTAFAVRVLGPDGVTPVAGDSVALAVTAGSATLAACGGTASCTLLSDSTGLVQTAVTGGAVGSVTLTATEVSSGSQVQVILVDGNPVRSVSFASGALYVAAGASANWSGSLQAVQDGAAFAGAPVAWSVSGGGLLLGNSSSATDGTGMATVSGQANGLASGSVSTVTGCAWSTVCAAWTVYGVDPSLWQVGVASGAGQSVATGTGLRSVTIQVSDGAGHPVIGAMVNVAQTSDAWEGACAPQGRCAAAPVLASSKTTAVSDANGLVTVTPLQVPGVPQVVNIAVSTGMTGFVVASLTVTP